MHNACPGESGTEVEVEVERQKFAISPVDGSVCQEKFGIHPIATVCC